MKATRIYQVGCYTVTFLVAWLLGTWFQEAFWQLGVQAKHVFGTRPLSAISQLLIDYQRMITYLFLFPWLGFIGLPLLTGATDPLTPRRRPAFWPSKVRRAQKQFPSRQNREGSPFHVWITANFAQDGVCLATVRMVRFGHDPDC